MLKSSLKDFVTEHLQLMFSSVKHTSQDEREVRECCHPLLVWRILVVVFCDQLYIHIISASRTEGDFFETLLFTKTTFLLQHSLQDNI